MFINAGYIESWGRGTNKIIDTCIDAGLPEPVIQEYENGINVIFLKDIYNEAHLMKLGFSDRQINAIIFTKKNGRITNKEYQELNKVSRATATRDLQEIIEKGVLKNSGVKGAGAGYIIGSIDS